MKQSQFIYFLLSILFLFSLWNLGAWGVLESSEARYAEIPREMLASGDWLMPQLLGIYHMDKPLMTYWISAVGLEIFGVNAFGARFFLQIAYLLQIFLVYRIGSLLFQDENKGRYAAIIYAGLPLVLMSVLNLTTDAFLNTFEILAVYFLVRYYGQRRVIFIYWFFVALGLALFTKGPVGILIPILMIYPIRKIMQIDDRQNGWHFGLGTLLMIAMGGAWFIALMIKSELFYHFFIGEQLGDRIFEAEKLQRNEPIWYYFAFLPATLVPLVFLLPEAIVHIRKTKTREIRFLFIFGLLIPFLFFTASSSKLVLYVLPLTMYFALVIGWCIDELDYRRLRKYFYINWIFYLLLIGGLILFCFGILPDFQIKTTPSTWIAIVVGLGLLGYLIIKNSKDSLVLLSLVMPLSIVPIAKSAMGQMEIQINGTGPIADFIVEENLEDQKILVWDKRLPSLSFELEKPIISIYHRDFSLRRRTEFQEDDSWKRNLIDVSDPEGQTVLESLVKMPSVFVVRKDRLPSEYEYLISDYSSVEDFDKWLVYFRE
ncbi:MAG: glycosyltransferase family 39 protein [Bacteroidia bacterium]|nr:glycosyltransferase family 39 protein [Bacteroidia bacterium]